MRFEELLERFEGGSLSHDEAAAALGISERTLRRWRQRYEEEGVEGLVDRRVGRPSPRRAPEDELERMRALYQQDYQGFTIKHFHEKLEQRHGYKLGYTTTRLYLQKTGTVQPAPRRGAHRRKRPRRPMGGMLLHQDGAKHAWFAGQPALDLIITMDDATSEIYSARRSAPTTEVGAGSQARWSRKKAP
jgi:transposase